MTNGDGKNDDDSDFYYVRVRSSDERLQMRVFGCVYVIGFGALFMGIVLKAFGFFN